MTHHNQRLSALRSTLTELGCAGFLVPMADAYQCEYPPAASRRLEYLTGFTGSSGMAIVLQDKAAFFTDGRYTLQARDQVSVTDYALFDSAEMRPTQWLEQNLGKGYRLGCDPWLHTITELERIRIIVEKAGGTLAPLPQNPIDRLWSDRPAEPKTQAQPYDLTYAGQSSADKRASTTQTMGKQGIDALILTDTASIAWLLNVRGGDTPNTPLVLSRAILYRDGTADWFLDPAKLGHGLRAHVGAEIALKHPEDFITTLMALGAAKKKIRLDPDETPAIIGDTLLASGAILDKGDDLSALPRAMKNSTETAGMRAAHRRDGAALVKFFAWLSAAAAPTELSVEEKLAQFRAEGELYQGPSFDTIAGAGAHGAIVHYRATPASNSPLGKDQLFLLDSGGQYLDGTTDVTRTIVLGMPTAEMKHSYTLVLKGHIALSAIRFPLGTTGAELDVLARQFLWAAGLDFSHGTGHGVGCYLGVHEGPQGISRRNTVPLREGMVLSNEPGYYKAGYYGIRIENLQIVTAPNVPQGGERPMMGFETLTLCPYDRTLIDEALLTQPERDWINAYHARVAQELAPLLDTASLDWLRIATQPL